MADTYDLVVIGAGPGGYVCAIRAAQLGLRVCLIEQRATLGGTCLNVGCIPSKALLESSELYEAAQKHSADHGIVLSEVKLDLEARLARKGGIVKELTDGVAMLMKKNKVTVLNGRGTVTAPGRVTVSGDGGDTEIELGGVGEGGHDEDDELVSGVYYVQVPRDTGELLLTHGDVSTRVQPVAGQFVFFAPDVLHEVTENRSTETRLSIGMNFGIRA